MRTMMVIVGSAALLGGCTKLKAPDRSECTRIEEVDSDADGTFDSSFTTVYGEEERVLQEIVEYEDGSMQTTDYTYDDNGCVVDQIEETVTAQQTQLLTVVYEQDEHCDALEILRTIEVTPSTGFGSPAFQLLQRYTPTYPEGDSSEGQRVEHHYEEWETAGEPVDDTRPVQASADVTYERDELDRLVAEEQLWNPGDSRRDVTYEWLGESDELLTSLVIIETLNGNVTRRVDQDLSYDDLDRPIAYEVVDGDSSEAREYVWHEDRWHMVQDLWFYDGELLRVDDIECDEEKPWMVCDTSHDLAVDGVLDEEPDSFTRVEYTCP